MKPVAKSQNARELLKALADSVADALEGGGSTDSEYYDQDNSPLPKTTYLRLVRRGVLTGYKVHGRVLVKRSEMHVYIERHKIAARKVDPSSDDDEPSEDDEVERLLGYQTVQKAG